MESDIFFHQWIGIEPKDWVNFHRWVVPPREGLQTEGGTQSHWRSHQNLARFGTQIAPVVAVFEHAFHEGSPVVAVLPTIGRAPAGGPGAQPGGARNQSPLCYASAVCGTPAMITSCRVPIGRTTSVDAGAAPPRRHTAS